MDVGPVPTSTGATTTLDFEFDVIDGRSEPLTVSSAEVLVRAWSVPAGLVSPTQREATGLPLRLGGWQVSGVGRVHFEAVSGDLPRAMG